MPHITSSIFCFPLHGFQCCYRINWHWAGNRSPSQNTNCVKSVLIRILIWLFWPETEKWQLSLSIQSECEKIRTRKTLNTDSFHAVTRNAITTKMRLQTGRLRQFTVGFHKSNSFVSALAAASNRFMVFIKRFSSK